MAPGLNAAIASYCYLDFDLNEYRSKLATAAAFVHATDSRYGFSSKDLRLLGGSEMSRIPDLIATDHEWSAKSQIVEIRPPVAGNRLVVQLYWDVAPLACENFATLCANGGNSTSTSSSSSSEKKKVKPAPVGESGKPLTYRNSSVHRVVPGFIVQGGDFVFGNGSGGESIFNGKKFKDERPGLALKHDRRGVLSMGNSGKNSNTSQFFLTFAAASQCDGKHVVFGQVISGWEVLDALEQMGTTTAANDGTPAAGSITITDCGVWRGPPSLETPGAGYWFDQPDEESYSGVSPVFMVRPRVAILAPSTAVREKFQKVLGSSCSISSTTTNTGGGDVAAEEEVGMDRVKCILEQLEQFRVDVVVVAPACQQLLDASSFQLPESWSSCSVPVDQVILTAKPAEALEVIRSKSWLAQQTSWQLDGMVR